MRVKYPQTTFELDSIDPGLHNRLAVHIDKIFSQYPNVAKSLEYVGSERYIEELPEFVRANAVASAEARFAKEAKSEIHFNPAVWSDEAKILANVTRAQEVGWNPPMEAMPETVFTHEFGHIIDFHIGRTSNAAMQFQADNEALGEFVSGYAKKGGPPEAWAEAFRSIHHTPREQWADYTRKLARLLDTGKTNG